MLPGVRRMERRTGFVVGVAAGAAIARPRNTVVVAGGPAYYPPPPQTIVVQAPPAAPVYQPEPVYQPQLSYQPPQQQPYPPQPSYPPQQPYPPPQPYAPAAPSGYPPPSAGYAAAPAYSAAPAYNAPPPPVVEPVKEVPAATPAEVAKTEVKTERRYFLIVNEANCSVLEVNNGNARPGAKVVLEKRRPKKPEQQSWYLDEQGFIRSKLNDYALESKSNGECVVLMPYAGDMRQQWIFKENRIVNAMLCNDCIGLKKRLMLHDDADVIVTKYDNKPYQHWRMEYLAA